MVRIVSILNTMRFLQGTRACVSAGILFLGLSIAGMAAASTTATKQTSHTRHSTKSHKTAVRSKAKASLRHASYSRTYAHGRRRHRRSAITGQKVMDTQRATEIQQALIQSHYLNGSPTGQWDAESQAAMVKYQTDNGWQSKITPDSRALIKLGLGPKQDAGEYSIAPADTSKTTAPADTLSTVANSTMPAATTQN